MKEQNEINQQLATDIINLKKEAQIREMAKDSSIFLFTKD